MSNAHPRRATALSLALAIIVSTQSFADGSGAGAATTAVAKNRAVYIEMPDGIRIAADLWIPASPKADARFAALVSFTRYWRARRLDPPSSDIDEPIATMLRAGYAVVVADARGSGASFGNRAAEFSPCETRDFKFVIDWIAAQSWSNGRVASIGISYTGNTAEHATYDSSPALVAAVPRFTDFDAYASILFPGGLRNTLITDQWATAVHALDNDSVPSGNWRSNGKNGAKLIGVKPVDADPDRKQLALAVNDHARNLNFVAALAGWNFRDDLRLTGDLTASCEKIVTPYLLAASRPRHAVPSYHWASWMDSGTAAGVLARLVSDPDGFYIIGPWTHAAEFDAEVFNPQEAPVQPSVADQYARIFNFLAPWSGLPANAAPPPSGLTYYTMGEKAWKHSNVWPPAGSTSREWFLSSSNSLQASVSTAHSGADRYVVNFDAGTGSRTRWSTQLGGSDVFYGDRREADAILLTYTSRPLDRDTEVTGTPLVQLYVASTHEDGALIAYLEVVHPDGRVTMISEGELRLIHRRVSIEPPPYAMCGPHHSFERKDAWPLVPGEVAKIEFALLPTSVLIPRGASVRLAIAGHDKDSFYRYPTQGVPILDVYRSSLYPSSLTLPVIGTAERNPSAR